jgi:hypothetical protein
MTQELDMKKEEAVAALEEAGQTINEVNTRMWTTALNPSEHGWPASLLSAATIPITNTASIGHLITQAVVKQVSPSVFDAISNLGGKKKE